MIAFSTKPTGFLSRLTSFLANASVVRYGVAAIIVVTVSLTSMHFIPLILRDLQMLREQYSAESHSARLENELLNEFQDSRNIFLRIQMNAGLSAVRDREVESLHQLDQAITTTQAQIHQLATVPHANERRLNESWKSYVAFRDKIVSEPGTPEAKALEQSHPGPGDDLFVPVEQAAQEAQDSLQASSASHIAQVATGLRGVLRELLFLVIFKIVVLGLLIWLDVRRAHVETQLKQTKRDLRVSQDRFQRAYESATVGMGMFKLDGTIISANQKAAEILGCEVKDLIGTKVSDFMAPEHREDHLQTIEALPSSPRDNYQTERRVIRRDGTSAWVRNSVTLLKPEGEEPHYFSISEEITHQKEANDRLAYLANYDPITNLPNRHYFEEQLTAALQPSAGFMDCVALLYLEIDSFDFLKGTFGRGVAEEVLAEMGKSLAAFRQPGELIARLDDHVFAVMLKAAPYDESSLVRGTELRNILHSSNFISKHRVPLSASVGIAYSDNGAGRSTSLRSSNASLNGAGSEAESLLKYARAAMLEARSRGGDSIYLADPALQERAAQRHRIELALLRGLREDEFRVVFQPQFEVSSGKLVRFEALCRWTSGELGIIPPDRFIPIAEQTGLIMEIGRRVLHEALAQARTWSEAGHRIGVAVNISPMQFMRPDFTQLISDVLTATQFPPELLELEITEGIFIRDLNLAVARIRELQRLGLSIALDDFGTGYSSLSYLQRMPIDAVKLDRSFVSDLTTDSATVSMVRSVLAMAEALNLRVVTEGVETEQQLQILKDLGCDEAQGYLLGRPESAQKALQRVMESSPETAAISKVVRFVS